MISLFQSFRDHKMKKRSKYADIIWRHTDAHLHVDFSHSVWTKKSEMKSHTSADVQMGRRKQRLPRRRWSGSCQFCKVRISRHSPSNPSHLFATRSVQLRNDTLFFSDNRHESFDSSILLTAGDSGSESSFEDSSLYFIAVSDGSRECHLWRAAAPWTSTDFSSDTLQYVTQLPSDVICWTANTLCSSALAPIIRRVM